MKLKNFLNDCKIMLPDTLNKHYHFYSNFLFCCFVFCFLFFVFIFFIFHFSFLFLFLLFIFRLYQLIKKKMPPFNFKFEFNMKLPFFILAPSYIAARCGLFGNNTLVLSPIKNNDDRSDNLSCGHKLVRNDNCILFHQVKYFTCVPSPTCRVCLPKRHIFIRPVDLVYYDEKGNKTSYLWIHQYPFWYNS